MNLNEYELLIQSICTDSYYEFFKEAWQVLEPTTELYDNWHIEYLCNIAQFEVERIGKRQPKKKDYVINIPPRSLKSSIFTIYLNAWAWIKYPEIKFITASYSGDLAIEHAVQTRKLIESDWYVKLFGNNFQMSGDQNVKSRFMNDKTGVRRSTSVLGTLTGAGGDIVIIDDPQKPQEAFSELKRQSVKDWYRQTLYTRLNDQKVGIRIVVMQRLHEDDLSGELLSTGAYDHICMPAEIDESINPSSLKDKYVDGLLNPERLSKSILANYKREMGTLLYAGQMQQRPAPAEGNLIKRSYFGFFHATSELLRLPRYFYTDSAYGKDKSDNSATICYSVFEGDILIWGTSVVNLPFNEFIQSYKSFLVEMRYDNRSKGYIEPKASGISIIQQLRIETIDNKRLNIIEDKPPTESKESRVQSILPFMEANRIKLLNNQVWNDRLIEECIMFPNAQNDDQVDALSAIVRIHSTTTNWTFIQT